MSQDVFNKLVTMILLAYAMTIFTVSWLLNKPVDLSAELTLIVPILTHGMHLASNKVKDRAGSNGDGTK